MLQTGLAYSAQLILARLLSPQDFGAIALITVITGFASIFSEFGLGAALVQQRDLGPADVSAAFRLSIALGTVLSLLLWMAAPLVERFYDVPRLAGLTRVLAVAFLLSALATVPRGLLQREMRFRFLARVDLVATAAGIGVTITLALLLHDPVALAGGTLMSALATLVPLWASQGRISWLRTPPSGSRNLLVYGGNLVGFSVVNYWARNVDNLLIGKWIGPASLGLYSRAYALMLFPVNQIVGAVSPVILPMLAALQGDELRLRRAYLSALRVITFVAFPAMAGLAVTAYPSVLVLFGQQWVHSVPLVRILAWVGVLQSVTNPIGLILLATGRTDRLLRWGLFGSTACIIALAIGASFKSTERVAFAYLLVNLALTYPAIAFCGRTVDLRFGEMINFLFPNIFSTALMVGVVLLVERLVSWRLVPTERLGLDALVGSAVYVGSSIALRNPALLEFRRLLALRRAAS
jgi:PST family polysaccharide transporter